MALRKLCGSFGVLVLSIALVCEPTATAAAVSAWNRGPVAQTFNGMSAVGALFNWTNTGQLGDHFCTASVVASVHEDVLVTAAHCVSGRSPTSVVFAPAYHQGHFPFGVWHISDVFVDHAWSTSTNPNHDFAFLVTTRSPSGAPLQSVTGGERLGISEPAIATVDVIGYPDRQNSPITCTNHTTRFTSNQLRFDCGGYTNGTSGGPFLTEISQSTRLGTLIGVVGGYEQGGDTSSVSYAARLLAPAATLYQTASTSAAAGAG